MVVAAYGLILPQWVLDVPRFGCLNIHASLLPRWRGAAPIQRAIEAGDREAGVTIMQMDAGLDTGAMLLAEAITIGNDSSARLHDRLSVLGARLIVEALQRLEAGALAPTSQPAEGVTYAHKLEKHEAQVDWAQDAATIVRRIRAFDPFPGASSRVAGQTVKLWNADVLPALPDTDRKSGEIVAVTPAGIAVTAINSIVSLTELQRAGGKRLAAGDFLRGFDLQPGQVFGG